MSITINLKPSVAVALIIAAATVALLVGCSSPAVTLQPRFADVKPDGSGLIEVESAIRNPQSAINYTNRDGHVLPYLEYETTP